MKLMPCTFLRFLPRGRDLLLWGLLVAAPVALAHLGPIPPSLKGVPVPPVPGLTDGPTPIVVDRQAALVLGKALFWDTNVGSDGMACASCHFHAGADHRRKNQLAPQGRLIGSRPGKFDNGPDGSPRGANYELRRRDFPFHRTGDPLNFVAPVQYSSDDVGGSGGTFGGTFNDVAWFGSTVDDCQRKADAVFHVGAMGTRRAEPRNAPTVINAVFNYRNLWDGRANNVFNGSNSRGARDPDAGVWVTTSAGQVIKQRLSLPNSALASQALDPPLDDVEMACRQRSFADLGRKLMWRQPLEAQEVHWNDSVLGPYANSAQGVLRKGLKVYYANLVRQAFAARYWNYPSRGEFGAPIAKAQPRPLPYNQFEANFGMFFALALQIYQSTLISDDSPFDRSRRDANGTPIDLSPQAQAGMTEFRFAHCSICHLGPALTSAAIETNAALVKSDPRAFGTETFTVSTTRSVVTRQFAAKGAALLDVGFANTGVTPVAWDRGLGGRDAFNRPLSFAQQYASLLAGLDSVVIDPVVREVRACDFQSPLAMNAPAVDSMMFTTADGVVRQPMPTADCYIPEGAYVPTVATARRELENPASLKMQHAIDGAFKVPTLRNVELTGPFMHNGSIATLDQVVEFYTRGGNFDDPSKQVGFVFPQIRLRFSAERRAQLLAFLKSLTDERVRYERAPFDHPALRVPHGHSGNHVSTSAANPLGPDLAQDEWLDIPAVGAAGRLIPLQSFEDSLAP